MELKLAHTKSEIAKGPTRVRLNIEYCDIITQVRMHVADFPISEVGDLILKKEHLTEICQKEFEINTE